MTLNASKCVLGVKFVCAENHTRHGVENMVVNTDQIVIVFAMGCTLKMF